MLVRGKAQVITSRGPDRRRPAIEIASPFIWFPLKANDSNKFINFGNVGEDMEYSYRGTTSHEDAIFDNAPWYGGEPAGSYHTLRAWMASLDANGSENVDVIDIARFPEIDDGSVLLFLRLIPLNNGWDETLVQFGGDTYENNAIGWALIINNGSLKMRWRWAEGTGGLATVTLATLTPVGSECRLLLHFNKNSGAVKTFKNGALLGSVDISAQVAEWGGPDIYSLQDRKLAITLGDNQAKIATVYVPGQRPEVTATVNMSATEMRDLMVMGTHGNTSTVDGNLAAIAAAFERVPAGQLPTTLKDYVEK